jgi:RsiW-degrading membrane proteinase PrsW (M82 family)
MHFHVEAGSGMHYLVAASGAIPAILVMLYFDWIDRKRPEPWGLRYAVMGVGLLTVIPAVMFELSFTQIYAAGEHHHHATSYGDAAFNSFVVAGSVEEASKIAAVFMVVWYSKHFDERMDGIVYGARAGLGFALLENCLYIYQVAPTDELTVTWVLRALLAVPGHALWSGMIGYFAARRRFDNAGPGLFGGYAIAVAFHGLYDFSIFVQQPLADSGLEQVGYAFYAVPILLAIGGWITVRGMARRALQLDDAAALYAQEHPEAAAQLQQRQFQQQQQLAWQQYQQQQLIRQQQLQMAWRQRQMQAGQPPPPHYWNWPGPPRK